MRRSRPLGRQAISARAFDPSATKTAAAIALASALGLCVPAVSHASETTVVVNGANGADGYAYQDGTAKIKVPATDGATALSISIPSGDTHTITITGTVTGGTGGNGVDSTVYGTGGDGAIGGGGAAIAGAGAVVVQGVVSGGSGGAGGKGENAYPLGPAFRGGNGGRGGSGVIGAASVTNSGTIQGGSGGGGGKGGNGSISITGFLIDATFGGDGGHGGPAIAGSDLLMTNLSGGIVSGGSGANAGSNIDAPTTPLTPGGDGSPGISTTGSVFLRNEGTIRGGNGGNAFPRREFDPTFAPSGEAIKAAGPAYIENLGTLESGKTQISGFYPYTYYTSIRATGSTATLFNSGTIRGRVEFQGAGHAEVALVGGSLLHGLDLGSNTGNLLTLASAMPGVTEPAVPQLHTLSERVQGDLIFSGILIKTGNSIWNINRNVSGANYASIEGGTLKLGDNDFLPGNIRLSNGALLDLNGKSQIVHTLGNPGAGGARGDITAGTLRFSENANAFLQKGTTSANLVNAGSTARIWIGGDTAATITLNGTNDVVYQDHNPVIIGHATTGPAGIVKVGAPNALLTPGETAQIFEGTLDLNGTAQVRGTQIVLMDRVSATFINSSSTAQASFQGGVVLGGTAFGNIGGDGSMTILAGLHGTGGLNKVGLGTLSLAGTNDHSGPITLTQGTLRYASAASTIWTQSISGGGALKKSGSGSLTLSGNSNYTGGTILEDGFLGLGSNTALGTGPVTILGGEIHAVNSDRYISNAVTLGGNFTLGRVTNFTGPVSLASDVTITSGNPDVLPPVNSTISGVISGNHGIRFTEAANPIGEIILSGANTYTGATTLLQGKLRASHGAVLPDSTDLSIASGAILQLDGLAGSPDLVRTLRLSGQFAAPGEWGAPGSGAEHTSPLLVGSGRLLVAGASPYEYWSRAISDAAKRGPNVDADGDGLVNLLEYAFGMDPVVNHWSPLAEAGGAIVSHGMPSLLPEDEAGNSLGVFVRRKDRDAAGLVYIPQFSEDLSSWQDCMEVPTVLSEDEEMEVVSVPWPQSSSTGKLFFRVKVTLP